MKGWNLLVHSHNVSGNMDTLTIIMWVSGWWYFSKLRTRIEVLEQQVFILSQEKGWKQ
jgi:hypothetical protein